jgi:hypothetical protein
MARKVTAETVRQALAAGGLPVSDAPGGAGFYVAESPDRCPVPDCVDAQLRRRAGLSALPVIAVIHAGPGDGREALDKAAAVLRSRGIGLGSRGAGVFTPPIVLPPDVEFVAHLELSA